MLAVSESAEIYGGVVTPEIVGYDNAVAIN
jgi:hypothetical protein